MIDASADAVLFVAVPILVVIYVVAMTIGIAVESFRRRRDRFARRTRWQ